MVHCHMMTANSLIGWRSHGCTYNHWLAGWFGIAFNDMLWQIYVTVVVGCCSL